MSSFITIVIPNYNHSLFLDKRIESILNQTHQNFELILLDDYSTDGSWEYLIPYKNHPKVSYCLQNSNNSGSPFKQWKKGIELAKYDWIWIAESDDFSDLHFLENIIEFIESNGLDMAYSQSYDVDENCVYLEDRIKWTSDFTPNIWGDNWVQKGNNFIVNYLQFKNVIPNASACVFNKKLIKQKDWDILTSMKICGDWLFWLSISENANIGFLSSHLNFFRYHSAVTRNHDNEVKRMTRVYEEFIVLHYIKRNFNLTSYKVKEAHEKWFSFFKIFDPYVHKVFYDANMFKSKFSFLLSFYFFKIKSYLKRYFKIKLEFN
ncbi:glycosyltransferase family 2 protein [Echinicola jeungdonensis]|uniref:Glycosyltransferase family 2 protein n=1 Tax=Echinicola jeungdonensis TaxID=709343 RepID=A0ABV5J613_9BACT|nr:glycosyltransferase family 2 protein [Echinicola jeungdonensis]MDN3667876.1 glycosyltransferase family 2 protein [Echinicola jeungdonensis]